MTIASAYTSWSATYDADRNLTRDLDRDVTRRLLSGRRAGVVLEIGCGTGKNTALLAEIGTRVLALDFSEGMLARARDKVRAAHVAFQVADVTQPWPCADATVDLVTCNLVLEHVEDLGVVFAQAARCLAADGVFFISELHPFRQYEGSQARFDDATGTTTHVTAFVHHVSDVFDAAARVGLKLSAFHEWWHADDAKRPPRLVTFEFRKGAR